MHALVTPRCLCCASGSRAQNCHIAVAPRGAQRNKGCKSGPSDHSLKFTSRHQLWRPHALAVVAVDSLQPTWRHGNVQPLPLQRIHPLDTAAVGGRKSSNNQPRHHYCCCRCISSGGGGRGGEVGKHICGGVDADRGSVGNLLCAAVE